MASGALKIAISAGELSGEEHALGLVRAIQARDDNVHFRGMGGSKLRAAGVETVVDAEVSANVMGFKKVLAALPRILDALKTMKSLLRDWRPDLLIVVDYPDFNFRLIKEAKRLGIPVLYFIPPSVWAWRKGRIKTLKKNTDAIALIYPFEADFYAKEEVGQAHYVGHPFASSLPPPPDQQTKRALRAELGLPADSPVLALFPGSRRSEIERLIRPVLGAFKKIKEAHPELTGVIAAAPSLGREYLQSMLPENADVVLSEADSLKILYAADAGVLKSGTSNLQAAFARLPFVMIFTDSKLSELIVKTFVKLSQFSIVNIIRPNTIRELVKLDLSAEDIAAEAGPLLFDRSRSAQVRQDLAQVTSALADHAKSEIFAGTSTAYERVAKLAMQTANG